MDTLRDKLRDLWKEHRNFCIVFFIYAAFLVIRQFYAPWESVFFSSELGEMPAVGKVMSGMLHADSKVDKVNIVMDVLTVCLMRLPFAGFADMLIMDYYVAASSSQSETISLMQESLCIALFTIHGLISHFLLKSLTEDCGKHERRIMTFMADSVLFYALACLMSFIVKLNQPVEALVESNQSMTETFERFGNYLAFPVVILLLIAAIPGLFYILTEVVLLFFGFLVAVWAGDMLYSCFPGTAGLIVTCVILVIAMSAWAVLTETISSFVRDGYLRIIDKLRQISNTN